MCVLSQSASPGEPEFASRSFCSEAPVLGPAHPAEAFPRGCGRELRPAPPPSTPPLPFAQATVPRAAPPSLQFPVVLVPVRSVK